MNPAGAVGVAEAMGAEKREGAAAWVTGAAVEAGAGVAGKDRKAADEQTCASQHESSLAQLLGPNQLVAHKTIFHWVVACEV